MSVSVPKNISADWRNVEQEDRSAIRKIQIKNIQREMNEMKPVWKESQQKLYGNMIDVSPDITLGQVLITEGLNANDVENNRATALRDLTKISDKQIAEYIVDRLTPEELVYLVVNFVGIMRKLRKMNAKLDKDIFISQIKQLAVENPVDLTDQSENLSQLGERNREMMREASEKSRQQQDEEETAFSQGVERANKEADKITKGNSSRREKQGSREQNEVNKRNIEASVPRMIRRVEQSIFDANAERVLNQSAEIAKVRGLARTRLSSLQDATLINANDAAPVMVGIGSLDYGNPTTPSINRAGSTNQVSPRNTPLTPQTLYDVYGASPPVSGIAPIQLRRSGRSRKQKPIYDPQTGKGVIYGRGYNLSETSKKNRHYLGKFYVEKHKLKDNILSVKYATTDAYIPNCKVQNISNDLKQLIEDVLNDKYNERLFTQLNPSDKRIFKRFVKGIKLDISINDDTEKEFQKNYQILKGEFQSGNDSPEIKNALKKYILEGLAENKINKNECHFLLYQLSL